MKWLAVVAAALLVMGCRAQDNDNENDNGNGDTACTEIFVSGVNVSVTDQDGQPVTGAVLTLTEGDFSETMEDLGDGEYAGAGERAGTYTLTVDADGFETATVENIVVGADECHVIPEARDVTLSPS